MRLYKGSIFKNRRFNASKLIKYGFRQKENAYFYNADFFNGDFSIIISIAKDGEIRTNVIEKASEEEYALVYVDDAKGEFVGKIKQEFNGKLEDIAEKCFDFSVFKTQIAYKVIDYVRKKYASEPEYLWEKFPDNAVFRENKSKKWYAAILTTNKRSLNIPQDGDIEVINLKNKPEVINTILDGKKYFPAYHMNKKHWFTICFDDSVDIEEIYKYIDESYQIVSK